MANSEGEVWLFLSMAPILQKINKAIIRKKSDFSVNVIYFHKHPSAESFRNDLLIPRVPWLPGICDDILSKSDI